MKKAGFGLSETILRDLKQAFSRFDWVKQVLVFGSRAKGNYRPGSDIDLAVIGEASDEEFTDLWAKIEELPILFKLDLVRFNTLQNGALRQKILTEGKMLYQNGENQHLR